jgi:type II secretory pathway component PulF
MPIFSFDARNDAGHPQRGLQEAPSPGALVHKLRDRGWLVLAVRSAEVPATTLSDLLGLLNPWSWLPPRSLDVELSLQQLALMLRNGLTLLMALKTVADCAQRRSMREAWENVAERIQQGSSVSDAMAPHRCFNFMVLQMVRVGELTGKLDQVLTRAAETLQRRRLLRNQMMTALTYSGIVLAAAIGVTVFMIVSLIPKLRVFLTAMGRKLPALTTSLLDVCDVIQIYGPYIVIVLLALTGLFVALYLWPPGRLFIDGSLLRMPILGSLLRLGATVQFSHGLGVLIQSGITLLEGLRTVEKMQRNKFMAQRVAQARDAILRGGSLAEPLAFKGAFMPMLSRMVAVGESAGSLEEVLMEVARFHENQLRTTIRWFSTLIEPVIIVVVGGIVGFVYISFFVAMFSVAGRAR